MKKLSPIEFAMIALIIGVAASIAFSVRQQAPEPREQTQEEKRKEVLHNLKKYQEEVAAKEAALLPIDGHLGSDYDGCVRRYGDAFKTFDGGCVFQSKSFLITCIFKDGICAIIRYEKQDGRIYDDEKPKILSANANGMHWSEFIIPDAFFDRFLGKKIWQRSDDAFAQYSSIDDQLTICLKQYSAMFWEDDTSDI